MQWERGGTGMRMRVKRSTYWVCPICGAHLDCGERCDCQEEENTEERKNPVPPDQGARGKL